MTLSLIPWLPPLFAVVAAVLFGAILVGAVGWRHPGRPTAAASLLLVSVLLFPAIWAAALWLSPAGPPLLGVTLVPALLAGMLIALVIAALGDHRPADVRASAADPPTTGVATSAFGAMFWLLMLLAIVIIVVGYAT